MDKYLELMNNAYNIAQKVLDDKWIFTESSTPKKLTNGQVGWEIGKIQYGKDGEYSSEVNGIEMIAARDCNNIDYFHISALCDDPQIIEFDASDIEIATMIGRCAQITEDFLGAYKHAWQ